MVLRNVMDHVKYAKFILLKKKSIVNPLPYKKGTIESMSKYFVCHFLALCTAGFVNSISVKGKAGLAFKAVWVLRMELFKILFTKTGLLMKLSFFSLSPVPNAKKVDYPIFFVSSW